MCSRILMISEGKNVMDLSSEAFSQLLSQFEIILTDCLLEDRTGLKLIERGQGCYRYLADVELADRICQTVDLKKRKLLKQESPRLEDILYEYYGTYREQAFVLSACSRSFTMGEEMARRFVLWTSHPIARVSAISRCKTFDLAG